MSFCFQNAKTRKARFVVDDKLSSKRTTWKCLLGRTNEKAMEGNSNEELRAQLLFLMSHKHSSCSFLIRVVDPCCSFDSSGTAAAGVFSLVFAIAASTYPSSCWN
eukprot:scaffold14974_cov195-Amphora_coffeaeformis.AAC.12